MAEEGNASDLAALKELIEEKFSGLERRLDERREADQLAIRIAKETADAALEAHNQLIRQMRGQATEAQRQLDKLTDTYATKDNLSTLEMLIDQRLKAIEEVLSGSKAGKIAVRGAFADLKGIILLGFTIMAGVIGLMVYLAQQ